MSLETLPEDRGTVLAVERTDLAIQRTIIAAERTLMAWIRTTISMIGFGFGIYKFFQYLPEEVAAGNIKRPQDPRNLGLTLIALGTLALAAAAYQHRTFLKAIGASHGAACIRILRGRNGCRPDWMHHLLRCFAARRAVLVNVYYEEKLKMNLPSFPHIDLFSAGINALNGVLVARHPSHNRGYTVAGLLIMAFFGGIGGGVSRDIAAQRHPLTAQGPGLFFRVPSDGFAGAGDLSLRRTPGRSSSARERWPSSSLSRCPGLRSWARIKRSSTTLGSLPRSSSG